MFGSIDETVPSSEFTTQTAVGPTAIALGSAPTPIVVTARVLGSTRATLPAELPLVTQTDPSPTATPSVPASIVTDAWVAPVAGSIRMSVRSPTFVTQTPPRP